MPLYLFNFRGVIKGSLGIHRTFYAKRDGATVDEARLKLYDEYEHIHDLAWKEVLTNITNKE